MSKSAVYLALGRPDRVRYGSRAGVPFETWIYTTTRSEIVPGYYPTFYGLGYYQYGAPFYGYRGLYGYYPFGPSVWGDTLSYRYRIRLRSSKGIAVPAGNTFAKKWIDHGGDVSKLPTQEAKRAASWDP